MDPFAAPERDGTEAVDVDLDEAPRPGALVYLAAVCGFVSGVVGFAYAVQLLVFIRWYSAAGYVPYALLAVSTGVMIAAALAPRLRPGSAIGFSALAGVQLLLALGWTVYVFLIPIVSALGILWPLTCLLAAALAPACVPPALRAASFRRRLMEDLG